LSNSQDFFAEAENKSSGDLLRSETTREKANILKQIFHKWLPQPRRTLADACDARLISAIEK
jgi:hypothetical protein